MATHVGIAGCPLPAYSPLNRSTSIATVFATNRTTGEFSSTHVGIAGCPLRVDPPRNRSTSIATVFAPNRTTGEFSWTTALGPTRTGGKLSFSRGVTSPSESVTSETVEEDAQASLEEVKVVDLSGSEIPLTDLWEDRKAIIAFARHFGCVFCRKRADLLASVKDRLDACGATLVLIGPGNVDQAKAFSDQTNFKGEVYADPTHSSYNALKFVSGVLSTFTPKAGAKIVQLYFEGYRQDWELSFQKDTVSKGGWQQGGILVAGPGKTNILYLHKDKEAGDDPDIEDILKACCS